MVLPNHEAGAFLRLQIEDWRQFGFVDIEFHPRLTVLTGANGTGKTSLLGILGRHFDWSRSYLNVAPSSKREMRWLSRRKERRIERALRLGEIPTNWDGIGFLEYRSGVRSAIAIPDDVLTDAKVHQYDLAVFAQQNLPGLYLSSHRQLSSYEPVTELSLGPASPQQWLQVYSQELRQRQLARGTVVLQKTPMNHLKQALIASAIYGEGNSAVEPDPQAAEVWKGFQQVLATLLPASLGYHRLIVRNSDVIVQTETGDFPIDEISGGLSAILEVGWQIFLTAMTHPRCTVVLDEPENHLHPSLQRNLIPDLLRAFPDVQFILATHSPFVVTASPDSAVYVLNYMVRGSRSRVESRLLDQANKAADADEVLRDALGVDNTLPLWAARRFDEIVSAALGQEYSVERLEALRAALSESGLARTFPAALRALGAASARREQ